MSEDTRELVQRALLALLLIFMLLLGYTGSGKEDRPLVLEEPGAPIQLLD